MYRFVAIFMTAAVLAGCASTGTRALPEPTPLLQISLPADPRPIRTRPVSLVVYDRAALEAALADPNFRRVIGMSETDYANVANNYQEAIRYIEQQAAIIQFYESIITELQTRNIITE